MPDELALLAPPCPIVPPPLDADDVPLPPAPDADLAEDGLELDRREFLVAFVVDVDAVDGQAAAEHAALRLGSGGAAQAALIGNETCMQSRHGGTGKRLASSPGGMTCDPHPGTPRKPPLPDR